MYVLTLFTNNIVMKIIYKFKNFINEYLNFDKKYQLVLMSSSLSFYSLISISSITILLFGSLIYFNDLFKLFVLNDIIEIIGSTFKGLLSEVFEKISINGFGIFLVQSIIYSASAVINRLRLYTDNIYVNIKKRSYIKSRFISALIFLLFILIFIIELGIIIYSRYLLLNVFKINSYYLYRIVVFVLELLIVYIFILIMYIYLPPVKVKIKDVYLISGIITLFIYLFFLLFKISFYVITSVNFFNSLIYVFIVILFLLFLINYVFMLGIIIIYHINNNSN